jgi:hypothetical protein
VAAIPYKKIVPPSSMPPRTVSGTRPAVGSKGQSVGKSSIPAPSQARVEVELLVFVDRPNPRWMLARSRTEEILPHLPQSSSLVPTELTGYRGFTVFIESEAGKRTVHVFHNTELERWLLNSGRFFLSEDLARYIEKQLG